MLREQRHTLRKVVLEGAPDSLGPCAAPENMLAKLQGAGCRRGRRSWLPAAGAEQTPWHGPPVAPRAYHSVLEQAPPHLLPPVLPGKPPYLKDAGRQVSCEALSRRTWVRLREGVGCKGDG